MSRIRYNISMVAWVWMSICGMNPTYARFFHSPGEVNYPRSRVACHPSPTLGTRYLEPSAVGPHSYRFSLREKNGIVYTCRGGHIDLTHVRKAADWTAFLAHRTRQALLQNERGFAYRMREPSKYHVHIEYPDGWHALPLDVKEPVATEAAIQVGRYLAYTGTTWHEILTWFGFKSTGFYSEYPSAFSWEDNYSNLLGTHLGARALRDTDHEYDRAVTLALHSELQSLGAQSKQRAADAGEAVRDRWFVSKFFIFCDMIKRNFDIGSDDGFVSPWLVPGFSICAGQEATPYPIPRMARLGDYGLDVVVEIEPREWERHKILQIIYGNRWRDKDRIEPMQHFGPILEYIRAQAVRRYGPHVDTCSVPVDETPRPFMARSAAIRPSMPNDAPGGQIISTSTLAGTPAAQQFVNHTNDRTDIKGGDPPTISNLVSLAACWLTEETPTAWLLAEDEPEPRRLTKR